MTFDEASELQPNNRIVLDYWVVDSHKPVVMTVSKIEIWGETVQVFLQEITYSVEHTLIERA